MGVRLRHRWIFNRVAFSDSGRTNGPLIRQKPLFIETYFSLLAQKKSNKRKGTRLTGPPQADPTPQAHLRPRIRVLSLGTVKMGFDLMAPFGGHPKASLLPRRIFDF